MTKPLHVVSGISRDWIIGWKAVNVVLSSNYKNLKFRSIVMGGPTYAVSSQAQCLLYNKRHNAPEDNCKCGFNAWHDPQYAMKYFDFYSWMQQRCVYRTPIHSLPNFIGSSALVRVGLSGDVIEGTINAGYDWQEWGYRASHQVVTDIFFDEYCTVCNEKAVSICAMKAISLGQEMVMPLRNCCFEHAAYATYVLPVERIQRINNVDIYCNLPSV